MDFGRLGYDGGVCFRRLFHHLRVRGTLRLPLFSQRPLRPTLSPDLGGKRLPYSMDRLVARLPTATTISLKATTLLASTPLFLGCWRFFFITAPFYIIDSHPNHMLYLLHL